MPATTRKELVSEVIYRQLRKDIITGKLRPGSRLVELDVAKRFNASQVPVREAFLRLEEQGLLRMVKHTGTFVSEIFIDEMKELSEHRILIEKNAISQAMYVMKPEDKAQLARIYDDMIRHAARNDLDLLIEADMNFHETLIALSGKKILLQMWKLLDAQLQRFILLVHPKYFGNLTEIAEAHRDILDAVITNDIRAAQQACEDHIRLIWQKIDALQNSPV